MSTAIPPHQDLLTFAAAARAGDIGTLRALIARGIDPAWPEEWARKADGQFPLHEAAYAGQGLAVEYLLQAGAAIDRLDFSWWTPLMHAVKAGQKDMARLLLSRGADPYLRREGTLSPLAIAVGKRAPNLVRLLLELGVDPNDDISPGEAALSVPPLIVAARALPHATGVEIAQALILAGADPEPNRSLSALTGRPDAVAREPALIEVCTQASAAPRVAWEAKILADAAALLIEYGAAPDRVDRFGYNGLYHAAKGGNLALAEALVSGGAAPYILRLSPDTGQSERLRPEWRTRHQRRVQAWLDGVAAASRP
ncbi:MAG: ankyrin repeat domain-containing protein [Sumerlaeia bacterium]